METTINIGKDFNEFPGARYEADGPGSGEEFRKILIEHLQARHTLVIELDDAIGYGSSFLEEAFGGLVHTEGFSSEYLQANVTLVTEQYGLEDTIWSYINEA